MATLHSLPAVRVAAPDPLTPARHRLRQTIAAVDRVSRETKAAAEQLHRLTDVTGEHARLEAELHRLHQRDQAARGEWQDELAAAKATPPAKEQVHREAVSRLQAAQAERGAAIAEVAVEICSGLAGELTGHFNTALAVEATIHSVREALSERARGEGIGTAPERISSIIRKAREEAGVPRDAESGRRLLDALATDPGAKLK